MSVSTIFEFAFIEWAKLQAMETNMCPLILLGV